VRVVRIAAATCLLVCVAACTPEDSTSDTSRPAPATGIGTTTEPPPSSTASTAAVESAISEPNSRVQSAAPTRPHTIETLDVPPVDLPAPAPKCTDSEGQPVSCNQANGPQAPTAEPTAPPATSPAPDPTTTSSGSRERRSGSLQSSTTQEPDR
jgi:hypothetical protein